MILEIDDLVGGYSRVPVLKKVSFKVEEGQLVGLIGLNGAGKSTTINHVIGLLHPFSGTIKVGGKQLKDDARGTRPDRLHSRNTDSLRRVDPAGALSPDDPGLPNG